MALAGKRIDRLAAAWIYAGFALLSLWGGTALINRSLESRFHREFLMKWEIAIRSYASEGGAWPVFQGANHVPYMDALCGRMRERGLSVPESNTSRPYVYRLRRLGSREERILLLCLENDLIFYGMSHATARGADRIIDGFHDLRDGAFTAKAQEGRTTYTGRWRL